MPASPSHSQAVALTSSRVLDTVGVAPKKVWEGIYMASVVNNADPLGEGRVTLYVPQVLGTAVSNWARPLGYGYVEIPPVNAMVHVQFAGGDINQPVYIYVNTNNTSASALSVGVKAAPQTKTATPTTVAGTTTGMTVQPNSNSTSTPNVVVQFPTSATYTPSGIQAADQSTLSGLVITGPVNNSHTKDHVYSIITSGDSSGNSAQLVHWYVDSSGGSHVLADGGAGGLTITGGITAVQPGTGTSTSNVFATETWHNATTIAGGWPTGAIRYKKYPDNTVALGGGQTAPASGSVAGVTIITLPTGYRPTATRYFPVTVFGTNSNYGGWAQVDTGGNLQLGGITTLNSYTFLFEGCRFPLD